MMTKGSKISSSSASKSEAPVGYLGTIITLPEKTTIGEGSYENKSRVSFVDKQTGSYGRATAEKKASTGEFQWKNGKSGTRNEYKESSTVRIGDQSGYTEVYNERRVRNVSYNKSNGSKIVISDDEDEDDDKYIGGYEHLYGIRYASASASDSDSDY